MIIILGDEKMKNKPMVMMLTMIAGWMNRQQQEIIEYVMAENDILREELQKATGKKRLILNDKQRRKLAILGKRLGRGVLAQVCRSFCPDTLLKWHSKLVAEKYDGSVRSVKLFCMTVRLYIIRPDLLFCQQ